jgi:hypothetical protein
MCISLKYSIKMHFVICFLHALRLLHPIHAHSCLYIRGHYIWEFANIERRPIIANERVKTIKSCSKTWQNNNTV